MAEEEAGVASRSYPLASDERHERPLPSVAAWVVRRQTAGGVDLFEREGSEQQVIVRLLNRVVRLSNLS